MLTEPISRTKTYVPQSAWFSRETTPTLSLLSHLIMIRVYSDWTRQRQFDGVKHDVLALEHMLTNRSIHTGRAAL